MRRRRYPKRKRKRIVVCLVLMTLFAMGVVCIGVLANSDDIEENFSNAFANATGDTSGDNNGKGMVKIRESDEVLDDKMLAPITEYFESYFNATANLEKIDITELFSNPLSQNARINQSALDYLIDLRLGQSNDLKMTNYTCGLTISEINDQGGEIEVILEEDHTVNFAFIPDVNSSSCGITHTFYLEEGANGYVISEHYKEEDSFVMLEEAIEDRNGDPEEVEEEILNEALTAVEGLSREKDSFNSGEQETQDYVADHKYNSQAAIKYAMTWVDPVEVIRNENNFGVYDTYGGNCNNYISQCLYAGGIPMDYEGDINTQWKWYGESVNLDETDEGRSPAWAGVAEFYTYASENTGYGMDAIVDDNVYSGSVGDILQYGHNDEWLHSVIITEVVKDKNANVLDYLINSNTTDRTNYPASAYGYSDLRLIKIVGWNEN